MDILKPHMHEECVFKPPTYFTPWTGRDETLLLLSCVSEVSDLALNMDANGSATTG